LTEDYYKYHTGEPTSKLNLSRAGNLNDRDIKILTNISDMIFSQPLFKTHKIDLLQAISIIMYFIEKHSNISDDEIIINTKNEKPYLTDRIIWNAMNLVKSLRT